jgi:hypothetical protein
MVGSVKHKNTGKYMGDKIEKRLFKFEIYCNSNKKNITLINQNGLISSSSNYPIYLNGTKTKLAIQNHNIDATL